MSKRKFIILVIVIMAFLLAGCGSSGDLSQDASTDIAVSEVETETEEAVESSEAASSSDYSFPIVDTNQGTCYDNNELIDCPDEGEPYYGQDAQYTGNVPSYTDNGDGTITDNVTGLVWAQDLSDASMSWSDSSGYCESLAIGSVSDWRLPNIKELWSIRDFSMGWPWIDSDYFYLVGDGSDQRQQHSWSSNLYLVESEYQNEQVQGDPAFIVNDWTGHIKAMSGNRFVRCVSGDEYGVNDFVVQDDGTVSDNATGLMWSQDDSGEGMDWEAALAYAEAATTAGYDDWRLPTAKELQSIADYSGVLPTIDISVFNLTELTNIMGQTDYPFYWSSTSNPVEGSDGEVDNGTDYAWVLAAGYNTDPDGYDLHGAGSVVFTPKSEENFSELDPEIHRYNYVRLVRDGDVTVTPDGDPSVINPDRVVSFDEGDTGMEGNGEGGQGPDFAAAAEALGVSEEDLMSAMGEPGQDAPDFAAIAETLGVTEEALIEALGGMEDASPSQ